MKSFIGKVTISTVLLAAFGSGLFLIFWPTASAPTPTPSFKVGEGKLPDVSATAWAIFAVENGELLQSQSADTVLPIASITKLATAVVYRQLADLADPITITASDVATEGRAGKLAAGEVYSGQELLFPLLLESSNDAAAALARVEPGLQRAMNELASELGLSQLVFADPSGLSDGNVGSAREIARFTAAMYKTQPHIFDITRLPEFYSAANGWFNNSPFISLPEYRGGKHGFTYAANRTAVALFEEPIGEPEVVVGYVLLGSDDLAADMALLRAYTAAAITYR